MANLLSNLDMAIIEVSFVIPVKNDSRVIKSIKKLKEYVHSRAINAEVIVCGKLGYHTIPQDIKFIEVEPPDKGRCIRAGAMASRGNIVVLIDADLPVLLADIDELISSAKNSDIVFGNRYLPSSSRFFNEPLIRFILSRIFHLLTQLIFQLRGYDTQCGVKALKRIVKEKLFEYQITYGFAFDIELALRAKQLSLTSEQIPVHLKNPLGSTVKIPQTVAQILKETLILFYYFRIKVT